MLLAGVAVAGARGERELTDDELRSEMSRNKALAAYVARNGEPDVAESHFLSDVPPWDDHEVTLYYFDARKEIGFARAYILGRPEVEIERYERPLSDEQIAALSTRGRPARQATRPEDVTKGARPEDVTKGARAEDLSPMGPDERAEEAARRAENAAGRVELAAESAERAADRAEAVTSRMESDFHSSLRK
ncbi:MAG TPA: hypothetical protein VEM57_06280 [Candidatus Binatus sp.]|nr:hypothetical protein [Candidatus Binatus sp.]